jgi:hypothetical protein
MRQRLIALGVATICFGLTVGISAARAQTSQSNCKTIEGPGYFAQACGTNAQVSGGPGSSSASTGPEPVATIVPTPIGTFTPVPTVVQPVPVPTPAPPAPRPAPMGLIGALLRLLGLG